MARSNNQWQEEDVYEMTSMIDVVFLLLIYFMYLPLKQEADLPYTLPADTPPVADMPLPNELPVEIAPDGSIFLNGAPMDNPESLNLPELTSTLTRLRQSSDKAGVSTVVTIYPDSDSPHQSSLSVLNACVKAKIKQVSFAEAD